MMNYTITLNEYEIDQIRQALVRDCQWWAMQSHLDKDADDKEIDKDISDSIHKLYEKFKDIK